MTKRRNLIPYFVFFAGAIGVQMYFRFIETNSGSQILTDSSLIALALIIAFIPAYSLGRALSPRIAIYFIVAWLTVVVARVLLLYLIVPLYLSSSFGQVQVVVIYMPLFQALTKGVMSFVAAKIDKETHGQLQYAYVCVILTFFRLISRFFLINVEQLDVQVAIAILFMFLEWISEGSHNIKNFAFWYVISGNAELAKQKVRLSRMDASHGHILYMRMALDMVSILIAPVFAYYLTVHYNVEFKYNFARVILPSVAVQLGCLVLGDVISIYFSQSYVLRNPIGLWLKYLQIKQAQLCGIGLSRYFFAVLLCVSIFSCALISDMVSIASVVIV